MAFFNHFSLSLYTSLTNIWTNYELFNIVLVYVPVNFKINYQKKKKTKKKKKY